MKSFQLSTDAAADIREIRNYIAEDSIDAARRFRLKLLAACRKLGSNPGLGHKRTDFGRRSSTSVLACRQLSHHLPARAYVY